MCEKYGEYILLSKYGNGENGPEKFGHGGCGNVYLAESEIEKDNKRLYVLKIPKEEEKTDISQQIYERKSFNNEIKILKTKLKEPNNKYTTKIYGSQEYNLNEIKNEEIKPFYAMDYFSKGSLFYYFKLKDKVKDKQKKRITKLLFKKIVKAVEYLHSKKICHLDLKPGNIMLDKDYEPIIIDFGSAEEFSGTNAEIGNLYHKKMTKSYKCPEAYVGTENKNKIINGVKADIFSLGAILFNLVTGEYGFYRTYNKLKNSEDEIYKYIKYKIFDYSSYWKLIEQKYKDEIDFELSPEFKELYLSMVAFNPEERPSIKEILTDNKWLKEINDLNEEEKEQLEEEYRKELSDLFDNKLKVKYEVLKIGDEMKEYITRGIESGEYNELFKNENENLKPKKILDDTRHINLCIEIKDDLHVIDFMNSLIIGISEDLKGNCKPLDDSLKIKVFFEENEEIDDCTMEIELFEYGTGRYLLEFMRTGGEIQDYYHYFLEIKKMISKN